AEHPRSSGPMRNIAEETRLPPDIDAQPVVRAAAALRSVIRGHHAELEREQRLPKALVEALHSAGFYKLVMPRELGGLQADPLTYVRVVELLAEGAGSVGWNVANNSIGQLITLGLPDEGVHEIYTHGADTVIAGTAVMGGGRAVPVEGGYRVTGRWPFGTGCQESSWMLGSFQIFDGVEPRRGRRRDHPRSAGPLPAGRGLRLRERSPGDGSDVPARWQHLVPVREPFGRVLARPPRRGSGGHACAGVVPDGRPGLPEDGPGAAAPLNSRRATTGGEPDAVLRTR